VVTRHHRVGLPVLPTIPLCMHASATTPVGPLSVVVHLAQETAAFPEIQAGRLPHHPFRGLLSVHSRSGLHARQTTCVVLYTGGFGSFVTSTTAPIATGWNDQLPGGSRTH
jgi:hypothetical protein